MNCFQCLNTGNSSFLKVHIKPHPPIGYFWNKDGKPKYPKTSDGIEVNDFITLEDEKEFHSDTFSFKSIAHAELFSKVLYFEKYGVKDKDLDDLNMKTNNLKTILNWKIFSEHPNIIFVMLIWRKHSK